MLRRRSARACALALCVLSISIWPAASPAEAEWYKGVVHIHSKYSDGAYNLDSIWNDARQAGLDFVFVTDHADCFGEGLSHAHPHLNNNYYDDYVLRCKWLSEQGPPLMIPGIEFPLTDAGKKRHMLVLGLDEEGRPPTPAPPGSYWYLPYDPQHTLDEYGFLSALPQSSVDQSLWGSESVPPFTVIAHPALWQPEFALQGCSWMWSIGSVGFFNPSPISVLAEAGELGLFARLHYRDGPMIGVTCDNDSHATGVEGRYTFIEAERCDRDSLLRALWERRSYASVYGAELENLEFAVGAGRGIRLRPGSGLRVSFELVWPRPIGDPKEIMLLLDGLILGGAVQRPALIPGVTKRLSYVYEFKPRQLALGRNVICVYCKGQLLGPQFAVYVIEEVPDAAAYWLACVDAFCLALADRRWAAAAAYVQPPLGTSRADHEGKWADALSGLFDRADVARWEILYSRQTSDSEATVRARLVPQDRVTGEVFPFTLVFHLFRDQNGWRVGTIENEP